MVVKTYENVLSPSLMESVLEEINSLEWEKHFTRMGSDMFESGDRESLPVLNDLYNMFSTLISL